MLACTFLWFSEMNAQELFENSISQSSEGEDANNVAFNGYSRGSAFGAGETFDYSTVFGEFCLQGKWTGNNTILYSDLRIRGGLYLGEEYTAFQLKEAYAGYSSDKIDVLLGNQIVIWGRTDGFNPTNNITPNDYFFLSSEPDDQKLSNFMLRAKYRLSDKFDIDLIGIPFYVPSVYRYDLFDMGQVATFTSASLPEKSFKNGSVAARFNVELPKIGFSMSYFRGYDPFHGFKIHQISWPDILPSITYTPIPYLKNTVGADFAIPLGSWIVRGEAAYNNTSNYDTNMFIPNPDFAYVAGIERTIGGFTTIIQYIGKYVIDFNSLDMPTLSDSQNPLAMIQYAEDMVHYESTLFNRKIFNQQEETNHALSLTINRSFAYDTWNIELTGYYNITTEEYMIRPKITWKISDALSFSAGASYMEGPEKSIFNYSGPVLNGAFIELKTNF